MIITVAQRKGGAGKTTMAAQLAAAFLTMKKTVATVDVDPQGSLSRWADIRQQLMGEDNKLTHLQATGWRTGREVEALARSHQYVFVDSPPHAEADARWAIRAADLLVIPVQPSPMDVWATQATLDMARAEGVATLIVPNRVPPRSNMADGIVGNLDRMGSDVSRIHLGSRVAYAESMLSGRGVVETARLSTAADEVSALAREIVRKASSRQRAA